MKPSLTQLMTSNPLAQMTTKCAASGIFHMSSGHIYHNNVMINSKCFVQSIIKAPGLAPSVTSSLQQQAQQVYENRSSFTYF